MSADQAAQHAIETMQVEERRYPPTAEFRKQANAQPDIYNRGFDDFWSEESKRVTWFEPWQQLYEWKPPYAKWYVGDRKSTRLNSSHVEISYAVFCLKKKKKKK